MALRFSHFPKTKKVANGKLMAKQPDKSYDLQKNHGLTYRKFVKLSEEACAEKYEMYQYCHRI
jgi:hypothetical protein